MQHHQQQCQVAVGHTWGNGGQSGASMFLTKLATAPTCVLPSAGFCSVLSNTTQTVAFWGVKSVHRLPAGSWSDGSCWLSSSTMVCLNLYDLRSHVQTLKGERISASTRKLQVSWRSERLYNIENNLLHPSVKHLMSYLAGIVLNSTEPGNLKCFYYCTILLWKELSATGMMW